MTIFTIGDEDTVLGFRLVGGEGRVVRSEDEARRAFEEVLERTDVELLFVTHPWARSMQQRLNRAKMSRTRPLVMEIPDKSGRKAGSSVKQLVGRAIGVEVE